MSKDTGIGEEVRGSGIENDRGYVLRNASLCESPSLLT